MNFESMPYGEELLRAMYEVPSKELSTLQIVEIIQTKLADKLGDTKLTELHVSQLYQTLGLRLIARKKVAPKPPKQARINPMDVLIRNLVTEEPEESEQPDPDAEMNENIRLLSEDETYVGVVHGESNSFGLVPTEN